jgi:hypothetical protein
MKFGNDFKMKPPLCKYMKNALIQRLGDSMENHISDAGILGPHSLDES